MKSVLCLAAALSVAVSPLAASSYEYVLASEFGLSTTSHTLISPTRVYVEAPSELPDVTYPIYLSVKADEFSNLSDLPGGFDDYFPSFSSVRSFQWLRMYASSQSELSSPDYWFLCAVDASTAFFEPVYYGSNVLSLPIDSLSVVTPVEGDGVGWLYNFGQYLTSNVAWFGDVLNTEILGHNVIYLMCSSAFAVYVSWVVTKWIVGL